ncbi:hypothetical protein [Streptomyces thermospinosisporus]|uniref:hypothetical protein n=1 Tax=Streptomyces thermospinosisporus TaxID=161482 RepID=UPI0031E369BB
MAFGPDRGWAVGTEGAARNTPGSLLMLRWDGAAWQRQTLPGTGWQGELLSIAGTSPEKVWAVGRDASGGTRLLRRDGAAWHECPPPPGVQLSKVVSGGGETCLIGTRDGEQALLRRDRSCWQELPVPPGSVYGLHVRAADDVWAAGATAAGAAVPHWDGQAWQQTIVYGGPRSAVGSVPAVSPTEVWAGGTAGFVGGPPGRPIPPLLVRWDGETWSRVTVPTDFGSISSLAADGSGAPAWVSVDGSQKWGPRPPGSSPPLIPGPDFLSWNGQSFTGHDEPAVAGEGQSRTLRLAPVPGTEAVWSVGRANGPENSVVRRILRFG